MEFAFAFIHNALRVGFLGCIALAAVVDARTRTFPNRLAIGLLIISLALGMCDQGPIPTLGNVLIATAICSGLVFFEALWRRVMGSAGLGMGDIKFLYAASMSGWSVAALSFAGGLLLMGIAALATRQKSLPLLPFVAPLLALAVQAF